MPLLKVAGSGTGGHILEQTTLDILEHHLDVEAFVRHVAGAEVEIEKPVVVEVAEIHAHWRHGAVEPNTLRDILKAAGSKIAVEARAARSLHLRTHHAQENLGNFAR